MSRNVLGTLLSRAIKDIQDSEDEYIFRIMDDIASPTCSDKSHILFHFEQRRAVLRSDCSHPDCVVQDVLES